MPLQPNDVSASLCSPQVMKEALLVIDVLIDGMKSMGPRGYTMLAFAYENILYLSMKKTMTRNQKYKSIDNCDPIDIYILVLLSKLLRFDQVLGTDDIERLGGVYITKMDEARFC